MDISHVIMQCVTDGDANSLGRALRLWKRQASYPAVVEGIVYMAAVPGFPGVSTCLQAAVGSVTDVNGSEGWIGVLCHLLRVAGHDKEWINEREQGSLATALHHVCLRPTVIDGEDDDAKMRARQREILLGVVLLLLYGADARAKSRSCKTARTCHAHAPAPNDAVLRLLHDAELMGDGRAAVVRLMREAPDKVVGVGAFTAAARLPRMLAVMQQLSRDVLVAWWAEQRQLQRYSKATATAGASERSTRLLKGSVAKAKVTPSSKLHVIWQRGALAGLPRAALLEVLQQVGTQ